MTWVQKVQFNLANMGSQRGMCEKNVRLGYGLPAKCASAKADMEFNRANGALHPIDTLPKNVAVPVFVDTSSPYEHIEVADKGVFYSDKKRLANPYAQRFFGWGEFCAKARVVEQVPDGRKSNEEIADEVIAGKWGNGEDRKKRLADAGYDYGAIQAIVNQKVKGGGSTPSGINVGDRVIPINWVDYNGRRLVKTRNFYFVKQIAGDRVVIAADSVNGPVYAAIKKSNLRRA